MPTKTVCGVLLYENAYKELGDAIKPYVSTGPIGKYIYCKCAKQNGSFLDMTFTPDMCDETVMVDMLISIPLHFVKFMASGSENLPIGFGSNKVKRETEGQLA